MSDGPFSQFSLANPFSLCVILCIILALLGVALTVYLVVVR